jgi:surface protein
MSKTPYFDAYMKGERSKDSQYKKILEYTTVPLFDTASVTNMYSMFNSCYALTTVPLFDTSSVTDMYDR